MWYFLLFCCSGTRTRCSQLNRVGPSWLPVGDNRVISEHLAFKTSDLIRNFALNPFPDKMLHKWYEAYGQAVIFFLQCLGRKRRKCNQARHTVKQIIFAIFASRSLLPKLIAWKLFLYIIIHARSMKTWIIIPLHIYDMLSWLPWINQLKLAYLGSEVKSWSNELEVTWVTSLRVQD